MKLIACLFSFFSDVTAFSDLSGSPGDIIRTPVRNDVEKTKYKNKLLGRNKSDLYFEGDGGSVVFILLTLDL